MTKKIFPNNKVYAVLFGASMLLFIYHLCLVLYIAFSEPWPKFINTMIHEYTGEFTVPNILAILLAIFVPLADILIEKIKLDLKK